MNTLNSVYRYATNTLRSHKLVDSPEMICKRLKDDRVNLISQIEFHPGCHCDLYRCPHCYGQGLSRMEGDLELEDYNRILDDVRDCVPMIQISGVATEPLTHPNIYDIIQGVKKRGFSFGLHTKGYRLNPELIDLLTTDVPGRESFITVSVDASEAKDYIKVHNIDTCHADVFGKYGGIYFDIVLNNLRELHSARIAKGSNLRINIAYLLFSHNRYYSKMDKCIKVFSRYCDLIRFSLPQITNEGKATGFISQTREAIKMRNVKYGHQRNVYVLPSSDAGHNTFFKTCYAQYFQAVIDKAGNVFPCPQTALKRYEKLAFGNVKNRRIKDILESATREKFLDADVDSVMKCRVCDRKDEDINITFDRLLG